LDGKKLKEVTIRTGGVCGSTKLDEAFWKLLKTEIADKELEKFKTEYSAAYYQLMANWEVIKCLLDTLTTTKMVAVPPEFYNAVESLIQPGSIFLKLGRKIKLDPNALQSIYKPTIDSILALIEKQINEGIQIDYIMLVGGFGQSKILYDEINNFVNGKSVTKVIRSPYAPEAILCGGALLAQDPSLITIRKAALTYGIEVIEKYDPIKFEEDRVCIEGNRFFVKGVFFPYVKRGQEVDIGYFVTRDFDILSEQQQTVEISIYYTPKTNVKYINDKLVAFLGKIIVALPPYPQDKTIKPYVTITMYFGEIELKVEAKDYQKNVCNATFEFSSSFDEYAE